jgi:hypothetical protein
MTTAPALFPCEHRLRTHEVGREDELIAEYEAIDIEVVAVDLPTPRLARRGRAEGADPIEPLAVFLGLSGDLEGMAVELRRYSICRSPMGRARFTIKP